MHDILVAGALHLDVVVTAPHLPAPDETVQGTSVSYPFGGKGGNQAVAAARMGARVAMAGRAGTDDFATRLLDGLDRAGVDRTQVWRSEGPSGMSVAIVDAAGAYGAVIVSGANLAVDPADITVPRGTQLLLLQNEIPVRANLGLARKAREVGARVVLNAAPARAGGEDLLALVDVLIVNRVEAAQLLGNDGSAPGDAAAALRFRGVPAVIVTLGADGLVLSEPGSPALVQPALQSAVRSTHGAGDVFIGALAAELSRGAPLVSAARFGQAAASLHVAATPAERAMLTEAAARARLAAG